MNNALVSRKPGVMRKPAVWTKTLPRCAALLALLAFAGTASAAKISNDSLDKVLMLSGISEQVGAFPAVVKASVEGAKMQARAQKRTSLTDEDFDALKEAMGEAFQPAPILKATSDEIRRKVSEADAKKLIAWFESDLGKKITQAEVDATTPEARKDLAKEAQALLADKQRMAYAARLDKLLHATDETLKFQERSVVALYTAVAARMNPDQKVDTKAYRKQIHAALQKSRARFEQATQLGFAFTYRKMEMAELNKYAKFLQQPSTRRFNDAARIGMMKGIDHAVQQVAGNIAEMRKKKMH